VAESRLRVKVMIGLVGRLTAVYYLSLDVEEMCGEL